MSNNTRRSDPAGVQSVDRAISVLEILARRGEAGVSEVAAEIDVHKSTAFRLLGALETRGLVEQAGDRGKYRLGVGLIPLAGAVADRPSRLSARAPASPRRTLRGGGSLRPAGYRGRVRLAAGRRGNQT